jgi:DNA polymerase-3 subunit beta
VKFRVDRDALAEAVAWAARSLPARPTVPVLAGLLLETGPEGLVLSSFDYEVSGRVDIDADVQDQGRALVSGRLLADITRSLPPAPVQVTTDGAKVVLTCGSARFTLLTLPVDDYPALPEMPSGSGTVPGGTFAAAVAQVAVAAGRDDTLPTLTGVRVEIEGDTLTLAATDRYRLAVRELTWTPEQSGLSSTALVPARTLADTAKALAGAGAVTVALSGSATNETLMGFEGGGRRTTTRLIDGEFPKYRALLPEKSDTLATVETAPFVEAVKRVALVAERNTPVRLSFSDGEVVLDASSGDEAAASEAVEASVEGEDISIAFNPQYLLDGLGAVESPWVQIAFTTSTKPAVITGKKDATSAADEAYRYLLMPVRISG